MTTYSVHNRNEVIKNIIQIVNDDFFMYYNSYARNYFNENISSRNNEIMINIHYPELLHTILDYMLPSVCNMIIISYMSGIVMTYYYTRMKNIRRIVFISDNRSLFEYYIYKYTKIAYGIQTIDDVLSDMINEVKQKIIH